MEEERTTVDFHYYNIIAGKSGVQYRAVGWPKIKDMVKIEVNGSSINEVVTSVKKQSIEKEREYIRNLYEALRAKKQDNIGLLGKLEEAQRLGVTGARDTHCHHCKFSLFGTSAVACPSCRWLLCPKCGSCNCNYSGPITRAK